MYASQVRWMRNLVSNGMTLRTLQCQDALLQNSPQLDGEAVRVRQDQQYKITFSICGCEIYLLTYESLVACSVAGLIGGPHCGA
jgi:hypothetical protein